MISLGGPKIGLREKVAVWRQMSSGQLAQGKKVEEFERRFADWSRLERVVAVNSGTSALHLGLLAMDFQEGDEVIVPAFTFAASANAIALAGARPVFCDVEPETFNIDPDRIEPLITEKTKGIMVVHLFGQLADMSKIMQTAQKHKLRIFEDAAQSHGAEFHGQPVGSWGEFAAFSFYPTKNMTTSEGGALTTRNPEIERRVRMLRNQGMLKRYENEIYGFNNRMTEISAVIGIEQLRRLSGFNQIRQRNAELYFSNLSDLREIVLPKVLPGNKHVFHQFTIRVLSDRDQFRQQLLDFGVETGVYYPKPISELPAFKSSNLMENAKLVSRSCVSLPIAPHLSKRDILGVCRAIQKVAG